MSLGPLMVDIAGTDLSAEDVELLEHPQVGSVILFSRNYRDPAQVAALTAAIRAVRSPHLLVAVDHEGGRVQRFRDGFTRLPAARLLGRRFDEDRRDGLKLAQSVGWLLAAELRAVGVDFSFAPCIDLDYGVSEIIGDRAFHSDPDTVAASLNTVEFSLRENNTGRFPRGLAVMLRAMDSWLFNGDPFAALRLDAPLAAIKKHVAAGERYFETLLKDYFISNSHRVTVVLEPDPELAQRRAAD